MSKLLFLFASLLSGQSFYALGMSALPQSSPKPQGFAVLAVLASQKAQVYSYSEMDFTLVSIPHSSQVIQTSVLSGIATPMRQIGTWTVYALGAGGAATTGNNSGGAIAGGAVLYIPFGKSGSAFLVGYEALRGPYGTQQIAKVGFGRLFH